MGSKTSLFGTAGNQLILATALIWAALIFAITSTVEGAVFADRVLQLLVIAAVSSTALVTLGVRKLQKRKLA